MSIEKLKEKPVEEYMNENELYLLNFWEPKKGNIIIYREKQYKISKVDENNPQQLECDNLNHIVYSQDVGWVPNLTKDLNPLLEQYNVKIYDDSIWLKNKYVKTHFKKPKTIKEFAKVLKNIRFLSSFKSKA